MFSFHHQCLLLLLIYSRLHQCRLYQFLNLARTSHTWSTTTSHTLTPDHNRNNTKNLSRFCKRNFPTHIHHILKAKTTKILVYRTTEGLRNAGGPLDLADGKLFFYTAYVCLHRWVCAHVRHFHLLSKQWSCESGLGLGCCSCAHSPYIQSRNMQAPCRKRVNPGRQPRLACSAPGYMYMYNDVRSTI